MTNMSISDAAQQQVKDSLPPIVNLDFDKYRTDAPDSNNRHALPGMHKFTSGMSSPSFNLPPPPYSISGSTPQSLSGTVTSPDQRRQSTKDEQESPKLVHSLPSLSEALKSAEAISPTQSFVTPSISASIPAQSFADAPRGPGNPFFQPLISTARGSFSATLDNQSIHTLPPPPLPPETRISSVSAAPATLLHQKSSASQLANTFPPGSTLVEPPLLRTSFSGESPRPGYPFPDPNSTEVPLISTKRTAEQKEKHEARKNTYAKPDPGSYNETIKRHFEVWDAELALKDLSEYSGHTLEFANSWSQRLHSSSRASYITDGLPGISDVDEMLHKAQRMMDSLNKLRSVAEMQQTALNEQRARLAHGQQKTDEELSRSNEDYKLGGFAQGDAKKRRGKAAPPGRCHSCNRAETPEWRRGPDGARTLCNACGLHYAKLTRKIGSSKSSGGNGSNLRPKSISETMS